MNALKIANGAYTNNDTLKAISHYRLALKLNSSLYFTIQNNLKRCYTKIYAEQPGIENNIASINQLQRKSRVKWISKGNDPFFVINVKCPIVKNERTFLICGIIENKYKQNIARIYIDNGDGFAEAKLHTLQYTSGVYFEKIITIDSNTKLIRFDPHENTGSFNIISFKLTELSNEDVEFRKQIAIHILKKTSGQLLSNITAFDLPKLDRKINDLQYSKYLTLKQLELLKENKVAPQAKIAIFALCEDINLERLHRALHKAKGMQSKFILTPTNLYRASNKDSILTHIHSTDTSKSWKTLNDIICSEGVDYFIFIKPGYLPNSNTIHELIAAIDTKTKKPDFIYGDEDKLSNNERTMPFLKPSWSFDFACSQDYITGLCAVKFETFKKLGLFTESEFGFELYQLLLHKGEAKAFEILHLPYILCHKITDGPSVHENERLRKTVTTALQNTPHFDHATLLHEDGVVKVTWRHPKPEPLVSLIIPTRDRLSITKTAVESILRKTTYRNYEILIIDNQSIEEETLQWFNIIQQTENVSVLKYDHPFNYSAINNYAVRHATGDFIGLINNDIEAINPDWLSEMMSIATRPNIGCVGAKLYFENDTIQHAGVIVGLGGLAGHSHKSFSRYSTGVNNRLICRQNYLAVTAACLLVKKSIYIEVNGLNETDLTVAFNDVDFCLKVEKAGYQNIWTPFAELYHYESISRGADDNPVKAARFAAESNYMKKTWNTDRIVDPYYHENLTQMDESFSLNQSS